MSNADVIGGIMNKYGAEQAAAEASSRTSGADLNKDTFMNLLATQMKYQDPLNPQSNEDMLAQMAQFSALEQMQNVYQTTSVQQAYSLIGKTIVGINSDAQYVTGAVESVGFKNGEVYLYVDGNDIELNKVQAVGDNATTSENLLIEAIDKINDALEKLNTKVDKLSATDNSENP